MASLNKVQLMGRLGADPEIRRLNSGDVFVNLRLATSESWRDKNTGERKERTEWHTVVIFNQPLAKIAEQYLKKGHLVFVEGMLGTRKWQDQSGQDRYSTEVVLKKSYEELAAWGEQYRLWWQTTELKNKALKREILELKSMFGAVQAITEKFGKKSERDFDDDIPF